MSPLRVELQTSALRAITKSCNLEDVHVAETENEAANEFLGVCFNATKSKKYSAELEVGGRVIVGSDFCCTRPGRDTNDEISRHH